MFSRSRRISASALSDERGSVLASVVLVGMLVGTLSALALSTGQQAQSSAARDRNHDVALGVAEAGLHQAMSQIEGRIAQGEYVQSFSLTGQVPEGSYDVDVTRTSNGFAIDSEGTAGGDTLGRSRRLRVTLVPPRVFPGGERYALFSNTSIELKNNGELNGDVWANDSVIVRENTIVRGAVTSAQSWVQMELNSLIDGQAQTGGYHPEFNWAFDIANGADIEGSAKASVSAPEHACATETVLYEVRTGTNSSISQGLTTCGRKTGPGNVGTPLLENTYTAAPAVRPLPTFTFSSNAYDPATYHAFSSVAAFRDWLALNSQNLKGTFYVNDPAPSQSNRIDLTGVKLGGDTTIVTNAPVFTNGINDEFVTDVAIFALVSSYKPPVSSSCDVNIDSSDCAIHAKNDFNVSCKTAVLLYASQGPVAVKNNQKLCGTIIGDGILVKNNQAINYDSRVERLVGFGAYEIGNWEELPPT